MTNNPIKLTNTLTREKQTFVPIDPNNVGMYVCGVTPYDDSHIGHARAYVVFDVLYRLLRHVYGENHVQYVRNFTDIDDKIIQRGQETGRTPTEVSEHYIAAYYEDMDALNILRPNVEPRVSTSLAGIVKMVDELVLAGYAYVTPSGDVMYRTKKFARFGALARRKLDEQQHGSRVAEDAEKESPNDFVLWKANAKSATKLEQAFVPADYREANMAEPYNAPGRPGWHIECSVMAREHLGPTFDIHGGGEDLQFPHHSCEIAQSEALLPAGQQMARFWMHNGFITVNGTKMSKSLGNFTTIKDALKTYSPEAIRLWLLQTHYRKPVDYSDEALEASEARWENYKRVATTQAFEVTQLGEHNELTFRHELDIYNALIACLSDDLNTPQALAELDKLADTYNRLVKNRGSLQDIAYATFIMRNALSLVGLKTYPEGRFAHRYAKINRNSFVEDEDYAERVPDVILALYEERARARAAKNWAESDRLRDVLKNDYGIVVEDGPNGQMWRRA